MSSGPKNIVFNPLERALSSDMNRAQAVLSASEQEFFRALMNTGVGTDDLDAGALYAPNAAQGNPTFGDVVAGFLFQPTNASSSSAITAGVVHMYDPDTTPNSDDSQYKQVVDPGTTSALTPGIALTNNSAGTTRIDVLEAARVQPDNVIETDNRDIFNTVTGVFGAGTVNKVQLAQLQYRIRLGTPGSGFPGTAAGWLPLAVMSVPTGTTSWDTVTIWDVRPLLADRRFGFATSGTGRPWPSKNVINADTLTAASGWGEWVAQVGTPAVARRLGGRLRRGTPGTDSATGLDLTAAANQDGTAQVASRPWYLYLLTPFGLPRWARYTDASGGARQPRSPRGIPVLSFGVAPDNDGNPISAITLPTSTGFAATTSSGVCIAAGWSNATPTQLGVFGDETGHVLQNSSSTGLTVTGTVSTNVGATVFTPNTHYPACARSLYLEWKVSITASGTAGVESGEMFLSVNSGVSSQTDIRLPFVQGRYNASDAYVFEYSGWVTLPPPYPATAPLASQSFNITYTGGGTMTAIVGRILGWKF